MVPFMLIIIDDDKEIVAAVYEKNYNRMLYAATKILGGYRGEEAVHDVFLTLMEKFKKNIADLRDKPALFFVIVVRNHSINLLGKKKVEEVPLHDDNIFIEGMNLDELIISGDREAVLIELIRALEPTMREILEYKYILDYSNKEIAGELSISQSAVSSRIDRAKKALRRKLEEAGGEIAYE